MNKPVYKFYSNCKIVSGASRSIISDLQRRRFHFIPNDLVGFVKNDIIDIELFENNLSNDSLIIFESYIKYLVDLELIFQCERSLVENFIALPLEWDFPALITNAIFDGFNGLPYFNNTLLSQLEHLGCNYLEIRIYNLCNISELQRLLNIINLSQIKSIDMIIPDDIYNINFTKWILDFVKIYRKIRSVTIHSSQTNEIVQSANDDIGSVLKIKEILSSSKHCGNIHFSYFVTNIETFTESQYYNSCLNRKISIDSEGNIKNCPSMVKSYGNIRETKLADVVLNPEFQKVWHIKKDEITKCKDCEFRHICTDCRAYIETPNDTYSAPLKCGYNPYTCEWEEWSSNPLKQESIMYYKL